MSDEFDDLPASVRPSPGPSDAVAARARSRVSTARLASRLYTAADRSLRARLLACLVRPLGPLGLVAVAAGAFAGLLRRGGPEDPGVSLEEIAQYSSQQILELASFVEQVSPEALGQFAAMLADHPLGITGFSAAAAVLLVEAVRGGSARRSKRAPAEP
jgi:hypothetical protein